MLYTQQASQDGKEGVVNKKEKYFGIIIIVFDTAEKFGLLGWWQPMRIIAYYILTGFKEVTFRGWSFSV